MRWGKQKNKKEKRKKKTPRLPPNTPKTPNAPRGRVLWAKACILEGSLIGVCDHPCKLVNWALGGGKMGPAPVQGDFSSRMKARKKKQQRGPDKTRRKAPLQRETKLLGRWGPVCLQSPQRSHGTQRKHGETKIGNLIDCCGERLKARGTKGFDGGLRTL